MSLFIKALIGALMVVLIAALSKTKNYYLAGLIPLFPTFALIAHYIVGTERSTAALKPTILFSIFSLIPYFIYLLSLYFFVDKFKLVPALISAAMVWAISAGLLVFVWTKVQA